MPLRTGLKEAVGQWLRNTGLFDDGSVIVADFENRKVSMQRGKAIVSAPSQPVPIHRQRGLKTELYSIVVSASLYRRDQSADSLSQMAEAFMIAVNKAFDNNRKTLWDLYGSGDVVSEHFNAVRVTALEPEIPDQQNYIVSFVIQVDVTRRVEEE